MICNIQEKLKIVTLPTFSEDYESDVVQRNFKCLNTSEPSDRGTANVHRYLIFLMCCREISESFKLITPSFQLGH